MICLLGVPPFDAVVGLSHEVSENAQVQHLAQTAHPEREETDQSRAQIPEITSMKAIQSTRTEHPQHNGPAEFFCRRHVFCGIRRITRNFTTTACSIHEASPTDPGNRSAKCCGLLNRRLPWLHRDGCKILLMGSAGPSHLLLILEDLDRVLLLKVEQIPDVVVVVVVVGGVDDVAVAVRCVVGGCLRSSRSSGFCSRWRVLLVSLLLFGA